MIVARRAPPVDVLRRLAGNEAAVLPKAFSRAGAPPSMQAVNDVGGDAARFKHKTRQRCGERSAFAIGASDCCDLPLGAWFLRPSTDPRLQLPDHIRNGAAFGAGGERQRHAVLEHRLGQIEHVVDRGRQTAVEQCARANRAASATGWRAGPGPQAISLPASPPSSPGRAERTSERIASTTESPTGRRRTSRCAAIRVSAFMAALAKRLFRAGGLEQDAPLGVAIRIIDVDLHQKAIELGFRQRVGAFLLQRILRRQHMKRFRQIVARAGNRDVLFLHCLQQRGLGARAGAIDFVGHQQLGEYRSGDETERPLPGTALVQHLGAQNIRWHQVRRELDALGVQPRA